MVEAFVNMPFPLPLPVPLAEEAVAGTVGAGAGVGAGVGGLRAVTVEEAEAATAAVVASADPATVTAYSTASALSTLPLQVPTLLVVGGMDDDVPPYSGEALFRKATAVSAASPVSLLRLESSDHFLLCDARTPEWASVAGAMGRMFGLQLSGGEGAAKGPAHSLTQ